VLDSKNDVWVFGLNSYGQLGIGDNAVINISKTPTKIQNLKAKQIYAGGNHTIIIDIENNIWVFGDN
jgi:alpha-tubulin suppressor-like RCC1 family protein